LKPLSGADGQVYAAAQGPLTIGGYSAGNAGNSRQVNHPTVGRIAGGGLVERPAPLDLRKVTKLALLLREPGFSTASAMAAAINQDFAREIARAVDSRRVEVETTGSANLAELMARIENLKVAVHRAAKVVVNERTGTIVMGKDVRLGAVSVGADGLVVSLREIGFFDSGSAKIRDKSLAAFSRIAWLLADRNPRLRIEGHTDNKPIHNAQFSDNGICRLRARPDW
jgi:flagellar P-ring protein precursor FlgI